MSKFQSHFVLSLAGTLVVVAGCSWAPAPPSAPREPVGLPNLQALGAGLYSGGTPEGDDGFESLRDLGVKTVVSVDGIRPDVVRAHRFGLRYVHIPVGYGGISPNDAARLADLARMRDEPIYVHCHHGQHRGPAAAALMRRCKADCWSAAEAVEFLRTAGTDPKYEGLYASVGGAVPPIQPGERIWGAQCEFEEAASVPDLTARMVEIDDLWDALKKARANGWKPAAGGSTSTAHLAVQLTEQFREVARLPDAPTRPISFRRRLADAEKVAADLEAAIRAGDVEAAAKEFDRTGASCTACHREHRDRKRP